MNATVNGSSCLDVFHSTASKIGQTVAYCLIFVVSLVGNSLIAIVVYKTPTLRKPTNFFIVNMGMSDLLYPIFWFSWQLTELHSNSWLISGPLGQALCKLAPFLSNVALTVSLQSLVLIAVDRFGAVVLPLRSQVISSKVYPHFILATWIVAMAIFSPFFLVFKLVEIEGQLFCQRFWNEVLGEFSSIRTYWLTVLVVFLYTPFILLAALYSIILMKLNTQVIPGEQSTNAAEQLRAKRNRNVLKLAIAIVLGFALCWLPWSIMVMLIVFDSDITKTCPFFICFQIFHLLLRSNCAINPLICFIFSGNYQRAFKQLFKCFSNTYQGRSALYLKKCQCTGL